MKKILFFVLAAVALLGCEKEFVDIPPKSSIAGGITAEDIFKATGCKPNNVEDIKTFKLFKDNNNVKYLYGSILIDNVESFWVSQYSDSGDLIWEITHKDPELVSYAHNPVQISNGNLVIANAIKESETNIISVSPVIVDKKGNAKYPKILGGKYIYTDIYTYDDFFFTTISQQELEKNPNAKDAAAQISNSGDLMREFGTLWLPKKEETITWISDSTYVVMNENIIEKRGFYAGGWRFPINLPDHKSCTMDISSKDMIVSAFYYLEYSDNKKDTISYRISADTGEDLNAVKLESLSFSETEKVIKQGEQILLIPIFYPENATNKGIYWYSSDTDIATVDASGNVKAISFGKCTIKGKSKDGGFEAKCQITVLEPSIEDLIKGDVYGSFSSLNGYTTGDVTAVLYNNSSKSIEVTKFYVMDSRTNKIILQKENCGQVVYNQPLKYDVKFSLIYKPLFIWEYISEGKKHETKYQLGK